MKTKADLEREVESLRKLLWLRHGCDTSALYGDDGEMQCNRCVLDFKRDSMSRIYERFEEINLQEIKKMKDVAIKVFGLKE